jgi:hypothetical protein
MQKVKKTLKPAKNNKITSNVVSSDCGGTESDAAPNPKIVSQKSVHFSKDQIQLIDISL